MTALLVLQLVSGICWLAPVALLARGTWRVFTGHGMAVDAARVPWFFVSLVQVGFTVRWLIWRKAVVIMDQAEMVTWATLYAVSAMCAIGAAILFHRADRLLR